MFLALYAWNVEGNMELCWQQVTDRILGGGHSANEVRTPFIGRLALGVRKKIRDIKNNVEESQKEKKEKK